MSNESSSQSHYNVDEVSRPEDFLNAIASLDLDSNGIIQQQSEKIKVLEAQLKSVISERDLLLCEVSRLKFELEIADLKRIHEDRQVNLTAFLPFLSHSFCCEFSTTRSFLQFGL